MLRFRSGKCSFLAGVLVISLLAGTGCQKSKAEKETKGSTTESSATTTDSIKDPTEKETSSETETTISESTTETEKEADLQQEALDLAEEVGVKEEEIHEQYSLFIRYVDCLNQNTQLGDFKDYMLHLFPVVADHLAPENESAFFQRVSDLTVEIGETSTTSGGEYYADGNTVILNNLGDNSESAALYSLMYHELMHFIDFSISGSTTTAMYYTGSRFVHAAELTDEESETCVPIVTDFITEGGADFYSGKYFRMNMEGYDTPASFLSGIEWIYGEETVDRLFFSSDSTEEFVRLMQEAGIPDSRIGDFTMTFNHETYSWWGIPQHPARFEDLLVDLYESKKGSGWKEDKVFMQILNEIYACTIEDYPFEHEELKGLLKDYSTMDTWSKEVLSKIDPQPKQETYRILKLLIRDGKPYLSAGLTTSYDFDRTEPISILIEYDFEQEQVLSCEYYVPDYPKWIS